MLLGDISAVPGGPGMLEAPSMVSLSYVDPQGPHKDPLGGPLPCLQSGASVSEVRAEEGADPRELVCFLHTPFLTPVCNYCTVLANQRLFSLMDKPEP